ncbi:hypothetical protein GCM10027443_27400 [Pontibacter brevis]
MKKHLLVRSLLFIVALVFAACEKEGDPVAEKTKGDIVGKVTLYDTNEDELDDMSGVQVEALIDQEKFSTITNANGEFSFSEVPNGSYIINFKKENFAGFDSLRFDHLNKVDSLSFAKLTELPKANTTMLGVMIEDRPRDGSAPTPNHPLVYPYVRIEFELEEWTMISRWIYFSKDPNVSSSTYSSYIVDCCFGGNSTYPTGGAPGMPVKKWFYDKGFSPGDRVYVVSYTGNSKRLEYNNPEKGYEKHLFPTHGNTPSNIKSFYLP